MHCFAPGVSSVFRIHGGFSPRFLRRNEKGSNMKILSISGSKGLPRPRIASYLFQMFAEAALFDFCHAYHFQFYRTSTVWIRFFDLSSFTPIAFGSWFGPHSAFRRLSLGHSHDFRSVRLWLFAHRLSVDSLVRVCLWSLTRMGNRAQQGRGQSVFIPRSRSVPAVLILFICGSGEFTSRLGLSTVPLHGSWDNVQITEVENRIYRRVWGDSRGSLAALVNSKTASSLLCSDPPSSHAGAAPHRPVFTPQGVNDRLHGALHPKQPQARGTRVTGYPIMPSEHGAPVDDECDVQR